MLTEKRSFKFTIWYFKPSGKFYTDAEEVWNIRANGESGPYMPDAASKLRGLRDSGGQGAMPGLSEHTEGWDGPILLNCDEGYPCLIMPSKTE